MVADVDLLVSDGSFMIGESPELSPRVKRGLPKTGLGRIFFTWFNPGPGTGLFFCGQQSAGHGVNIPLWGRLLELAAQRRRHAQGSVGRISIHLLLLLSYVVIYLGITGLLLRGLRRFARVTVVTSLLVSILVLIAGWGIPRVIREMTDYHPNARLHLAACHRSLLELCRHL